MLFFFAAYAFIRNNDNELEPTTIKTYFWNLKKLEYFRPGLQCEEIDKAFIHSYKAHLQEQGNKPATVNKALSVFRIFLNKLIANGFKMDNPFAGFRIGRVYSRRGFLTIRELRNLFWNYTDSKNILDSRESEAMRVFLFSCFTGLRYSDLKSLDAMEIADWKIRKQTHKTGEAVYIPIPAQARLLIEKRPTRGPVFHVAENTQFNRKLRSAAQKLGCNRYLHCHLARHTFATTCITIGIPLPATGKLLGHRNLATTLIYAKYVDAFLDKEMKKFNRLR